MLSVANIKVAYVVDERVFLDHELFIRAGLDLGSLQLVRRYGLLGELDTFYRRIDAHPWTVPSFEFVDIKQTRL